MKASKKKFEKIQLKIDIILEIGISNLESHMEKEYFTTLT